MYPPVDPIIFELGPFGNFGMLSFRWYGVLIITAVLAASWVAARYVQRKGYDPNTVWDALLWVLIPGLIGARLYYVFIQAPRAADGSNPYLTNPALIPQIWTGGIHIFGGFIFGAIALMLYARYRKLPLLTYLDAAALGLPLGQAIGRLGNFINQELYGPPTTFPWGLRIDADKRIAPYNDLATYPETTLFHPLFLYEMLWSLLGFALILWISRRFAKQLRRGDLILLYLIWYPLGRFFIEFLRTDSWFFVGTPFNVVHILSAITVVGAIIALILRHRRGEVVEAEPETPFRPARVIDRRQRYRRARKAGETSN